MNRLPAGRLEKTIEQLAPVVNPLVCAIDKLVPVVNLLVQVINRTLRLMT